MKPNKTQVSDASVAQYLQAIEDDSRREDCLALIELMTQASGHTPRMWGSSIVGFGSYHYRYESGREGDACMVGFSSRKGDISIYLMASGPTQQALLARLGRHKMGKACLYVRQLSDVDPQVLQDLVRASMAETQARYP